MSDAAAILATFATWRPVQGRKVLQLIFEVPLEDQGKVLTHLGAPMPGEQKWCGIALVSREGKGEAPTREDGGLPTPTGTVQQVVGTPPSPTKPKRRWQDMPASQRAALWVKDKGVWTYITEAFGFECWSEDVADHWLKKRLHIVSKSELDTDDAAAHHFDLLSSKFRAWQQARGHGVV